MTYNKSVIFIETSHFTHWIARYLKEEEYRELQNYLMEHPEEGVLIQGGGKSGGARVIYYWAKSRAQIYMLTAYAKNEKENIDAETLKRITQQLGGIK